MHLRFRGLLSPKRDKHASFTLITIVAAALLVSGVFVVYAQNDVSIVSVDPAVVSDAFTPELADGDSLARSVEVFLGRTATYTGPAIGTGDPETIFWRVTVSGPSPLTADMVDLDEVGWTDQTDSSTTEFHYPLSNDENGNLVSTGSCDEALPSGHVGGEPCTTDVGFSLVANDVFTNADNITFSSDAPFGTYTITYELIDTSDNTVLSNPYAVAVNLVDDSVFDVCAAGCNNNTIQAAVDAAASGDTINVAAGTYDEQVVIDSKSITIEGVGNTTVIKPSSASKLVAVYTTGSQTGAFFNGIAIASIIDVRNGGTAGVTIRDLKVDGDMVTVLPAGAGHVAGILFGETGGLINNVTVQDTNNVSPASVRTYSIWLDAVGVIPVEVDVTNSMATFYGRNGINARGNSITVNFDNNAVIGPGTVGPAQVPNGMLLIAGAGGTVTNNTISANHYTGETFLGSGVLLFQARDGILVSGNEIFDTDDAVLLNATNLTVVQNNNLHNNVKGVRIEAGGAANNIITGNVIVSNTLFGIDISDSAGAGNAAHNNSITGSATAGVKNLNANTFDATSNWWGDATGPNHSTDNPTAIGDAVSENVDFSPWLDASGDGAERDHNVEIVDGGNFNSIQAAIDAAVPEDVIQVAAGTYAESIQMLAACGNEPASLCIDKSLTLRGDPGDATAGPGSNAPILDGAGLSNGSAIALLRDGSAISNVTIEGFVIRNYTNPGSQGGVGSGVIAWDTDASNVIVQDNSFEDLGWNGVLVGSDGDIIQSGWTVPKNIIENAAYAGVELTNVTDSTISGNEIKVSNGNWDAGDSGVGIEVAVRAHGSQNITAGTDVVVSGNTISGAGANARAGVNLLARAYTGSATANLAGVTVDGNSIVDNSTRGVYVVAESRNGGTATVENLTVENNILSGNSVGIKFGYDGATHTDGAYDADTIAIEKNKIDGNTDGLINTTSVTVTATSNWWGAPTGPTHAGNNVGGLGDEVSNNVAFTPWYINSTLTTLSGGATIESADPALVSEGFAPEIGLTLARGSEAYLDRTTTYIGPDTFPTDGDSIQWRVTVSGPLPLTADMVDLDEVGFLDPPDTESSLGTFHYPFSAVGGNLVANGSCTDPDDHVCAAGTDAFSLDQNDVFSNADRIVFNSTAPNGTYTITYELVNTADNSVVGTFTKSVIVVSSVDGVVGLELTNDTVLNLSSSVLAQAPEDVVVGGITVTLQKSVVLESGLAGAPIVITNSGLGGATVTIPNGTTIRGPSGWNGAIQPPKTGSTSGTAPSGFSIGGTVISVGSPDVVLLFDQAVTLTLSGVTGAIGYKPAGSDTWVQITNTCGGTFDSPADPAFPGECAINNGTDTKIITFHFTTFGSLTAIPAPAPSSGGGGGGSINLPAPTPPAPLEEVLGVQSPHGNGTLIADGPTVYLVVNGQRRPFRNAAEYLSYGFNFSSVVPANSGDLALPQAGILKAMDGTLALDTSDNRTIYMVGSNGTKRGFVSAAVFRQLGYKFSQAVKLDLSDYQTGHPITSATVAHPDGTLVISGKTIWWINNGQRHGFTSMDSFRSYGWTIGKVLKASAADMALLEGSVVLPRTEALSTGGWLV